MTRFPFLSLCFHAPALAIGEYGQAYAAHAVCHLVIGGCVFPLHLQASKRSGDASEWSEGRFEAAQVYRLAAGQFHIGGESPSVRGGCPARMQLLMKSEVWRRRCRLARTLVSPGRIDTGIKLYRDRRRHSPTARMDGRGH